MIQVAAFVIAGIEEKGSGRRRRNGIQQMGISAGCWRIAERVEDRERKVGAIAERRCMSHAEV